MPSHHASSTLLQETAESGARLLTLRWLDAAQEDAEALSTAEPAGHEEHDSNEDIHDFRVAVRHLRSVLRVYRPWLRGAQATKIANKLGGIAATTGAARDLAVQLEWLQRYAAGRRPNAAFGKFVAKLETRLVDERQRVRDEAAPALLRLASKVRGRLATCVVRLDEPQPSFAQAAGQVVQDLSRALQGRLEAIADAHDAAAIHRARIAGKRLRYALNGLADDVKEVEALVEALKELQDILGGLHDLQLLHDIVVDQLAPRRTASRKRSNAEAALVDEIDQLFARLTDRWSAPRREAILGKITALGARLAGLQEGVEIERKYLLRGVPEAVMQGTKVTIQQGWLPGTKIHERLRRIESSAGIKYLRTIKLGTGLRRTEVEEEIPVELFDKLWPLTAGKRVVKERYTRTVGSDAWEIDVFEGQDLVVAELELTSEDAAVTMPDWLAPHMVREVTREPQYANINLAH